jgi:cytochrome P450
MCLNESLRLDSPSMLSFDVKLTESTYIGNMWIKDSTIININMWNLHHNED